MSSCWTGLDLKVRSPLSEDMVMLTGEIDNGGGNATGGLRGEGVVFEGEVEGETEGDEGGRAGGVCV